MNFSAVILAGGKSSRMGRDKAFLEIDGQMLLRRQIELVREIGAREIFISGRTGVDYSTFGCEVLQDRFPGSGPLAGIERGLAISTSPLVLALAVDMPGMTSEFLRALFAQCGENVGLIPRTVEGIEPLAAFYPKAAHPLCESLLGSRQNAASGFAEQCVEHCFARFINVQDTACFSNWNSPVDVKLQPNVR